MWRLFLLLASVSLHAEITALYLSWYGDPTTTMTIQWHTPQEMGRGHLSLYDKEKWVEYTPKETLLDTTLIHAVHLSHLDPDTEYHFQIQGEEKEYFFKTAPAKLSSPLKFIVGGDLYHTLKLFRKMAKTVMENDPDFIVIGGDIAYAFGAKPSFNTGNKRWFSFFKDWKNLMISENGKVTPFLIVPGNHDIATDNYTTFFKLFAFPEKQLYRSIDFGNYLSLILLDTGHFQPIEGRQTHWLNKTLKEKKDIPFRFAIYHEAAFPSHYPFDGNIPQSIRKNWVPLFEKYDLSAAFENHNHSYKRTFPIKDGKIDKTGIVYLGDGSWGGSPRQTNSAWYLENRAKKNSVFLVELNEVNAKIEAIDLTNNIIDKIELTYFSTDD